MTKIQWTDETWNPLAGCSVVSPGCTNCYAMKMAARLERMSVVSEQESGDPGPLAHYRGTTKDSKGGAVWTGVVNVAPVSTLLKPLRWTRPRLVFVNSMSDLFHPSVPMEAVDRIFAVMALANQHIFQVLTKRPDIMRAYLLSRAANPLPLGGAVGTIAGHHGLSVEQGQEATERILRLPLPNVWLGVSTEDQVRLDQRVPLLLDTPAAVRFISAEPLLGWLDLRARDRSDQCIRCGEGPEGQHDHPDGYRTRGLDWVIAGGESGHGWRDVDTDAFRSIRDQCARAGVPFMMKQMPNRAEIPEDLQIREYPNGAHPRH